MFVFQRAKLDIWVFVDLRWKFKSKFCVGKRRFEHFIGQIGMLAAGIIELKFNSVEVPGK